MLGKELLAYVDHTLLRPTATWDDIKEVCEDGIRYKTASVLFLKIVCATKPPKMAGTA